MILQHIEKLVDMCFAHFPRRRPDVGHLADVRLVAHRGAHDASLNIQENTHAAFERAAQLGCYGIEFDVHASADGVLVVNHDATLKRLWGHDVSINAHTFEALRALVPLLPSLDEVILRYGKRMHLFIEIKTPFTAVRALAYALNTLTPCEDYHLLSLDDTVWPALNLFPKKCMLLVPVHNNVGKYCNLSLQQQYGGVLGHYLMLKDNQIQQLRRANQIVGVGIVDSKFSLYRELNRGLRFLFSNQVATITSCLHELQK